MLEFKKENDLFSDYQRIDSFCGNKELNSEYMIISSSIPSKCKIKDAKNHPSRIGKLQWIILAILMLSFILAGGCASNPSEGKLETVDYSPTEGGDWEVSTPEEQGIDPMLIARFYYDAEDVDTITSLLVIKNGKLIAEKYFHDGAADKFNRIQSVTKSFTSALVGISIDQGYISDVGVKMMDYFPEQLDRVKDERKNDITLQQLLEMRAGYPWEESSQELFDILYGGFKPDYAADIPLIRDPGTGFDYSNLSSHFAGIIVARATGTDLLSYAQRNLFGPLGIEPGDWIKDWEGYYNGHADLHMKARDLAKFGQLYLDGGVYNGSRIISEDWVNESLKTYTENAWYYKIGRNMSEIGYGYQWWSNDSGGHPYNFAWGHGGQQIALVHDIDMVIVLTADPLVGRHGDEPWKLEKQNLNLVADFISTLPSE